MEEVEITANLDFVGHGHRQQILAGWNGGHALRYYTYLILEGSDFRNEVMLAYGASSGCDCQLNWTDDSEASGDVCDESKRDSA